MPTHEARKQRRIKPMASEPLSSQESSTTDEQQNQDGSVLKQQLLQDAAAKASAYVASERDGKVGPSLDDSPTLLADLRSKLAVSLDDPITPEVALELLHQAGVQGAVRSTGGRYFGFVNGGVQPVALASSMLAGAWDQNVALPVMSPVGSTIDEIAASWVIDVLQLPGSATASFCAGASVANFTAIVSARDHLLSIQGWDCSDDGLTGAPPLTIVASAEIHVSVLRALRLAGLGTSSVIMVPTDRYGRLDPAQMPLIDGPTLVLLQAGNVNTGHSDPFDEIIGSLDREQTWVHIDGAFGLWANASDERRRFVSGVEHADSWATDAHKWLNAPYDCGLVICADGSKLRRSMAMDASYVPSEGELRPLMNLGIQMSQGARAVPVWAVLATEGRTGVAAMVDRCCDAANRFASQLQDAGVTVLAPVVLNQVLVSFGEDAVTDRVVSNVQSDGRCWMGATTWQGQRAMRISVSDTSTTSADVDEAVKAILSAWNDSHL